MWALLPHISHCTYSHEALLLNAVLNKYIPVVFFFLKGQCWEASVYSCWARQEDRKLALLIQAAQISVLCWKPLHTRLTFS